ncbi:unnamed protein product, partial [Mesorhabditis spiculigera]
MFLLLLLLAVVSYVFHEVYWKRRKLPPGPTPLGVFGNTIEIYQKAPGYEAYGGWGKKYGPVHTYWMGTQPIIGISDFALIKQHIINDGDKYTARWSMNDLMLDFVGGDYGIIGSMGELWREQRRLTLHIMRDFGMGRNIMEDRVMVEVDFLIDRLASLKTEVSVQHEFDIAVGSVINNILFGYRFDEQHLDEFSLVKESLRDLVKILTTPLFSVAMMTPQIRGIPPFKGLYQKFYDTRDVLLGFIRRQIEMKKRMVKYEAEESEDFVESYLKEWEKKKGTDQEGYYFEQQLVAVVVDIWTAGMETTSNTLTWAICYILNHQEVQEKLHEELDRVIKSDRKVTAADKNNLPYVNAVVSEAQRLCNLLPQNLFRVNTEDVTIGGYSIPAGSVIVPQISAVMYDERVFPEPYSFKPERFLKPDGTYKKYEELVPFSVGKRACVGEGLAKLELYLFLANIFQSYRVTARTLPSMEKGCGQIVTCKPYKLLS